MKKLRALIHSLGGVLEITTFEEYVDLIAVCPDEYQWVDGQCINMTERYYKTLKDQKDEAIEILTRRVAMGTEHLDETINPQ